MRDDLHAGVGLAIGAQLLSAEALMHLAMALPGDDLDAGLGLHPFGEIFVRDEDDPLDPKRLDHAHRVGRGAADVGLSLDLRRGIDIGHHRHAGIGFAERPHVGAGDGGRQRAAGPRVGDQHQLVGAEQLRGLGHEMHAALDDDLGVGLGSLARKL
jgi:hypothetical protein